jgi:hypothetical protein
MPARLLCAGVGFCIKVVRGEKKMVTKIVNKTPDYVTAERLREVLDYCKDTGVFRRKTSNKGGIGSIAGSVRGDGYIRIGITCNGKFKSYAAHRLAWLYMHGFFPDCMIDHIDGNKTNNAFNNLRLSDCSKNAINSKNDFLMKGVSFHKVKGQWRATIRRRGINHHIGHFKSKDNAAMAYMLAKEMECVIRGGSVVRFP